MYTNSPFDYFYKYNQFAKVNYIGLFWKTLLLICGEIISLQAISYQLFCTTTTVMFIGIGFVNEFPLGGGHFLKL